MKVKQASRDTLQRALGIVRKHLRVTKVVCTRAVKTRAGENYVGFSACWDTIQDDAGTLDSISTQDEKPAVSGMTLKEARVAAHVLGMQTDITAYDHALAGGGITAEQHAIAIRSIKHNYMRVIADDLGIDLSGEG